MIIIHVHVRRTDDIEWGMGVEEEHTFVRYDGRAVCRFLEGKQVFFKYHHLTQSFILSQRHIDFIYYYEFEVKFNNIS